MVRAAILFTVDLIMPWVPYSGVQFEGDLGKILALAVEISPCIGQSQGEVGFSLK